MNLKKLENKDIEIFKKYLKISASNHSPYSLSAIFLWDECVYNTFWLEYNNFLIISENSLNNSTNGIILPLPYSNLSIELLIEILKSLKRNHVYYVPKDFLDKHMDEISSNFNVIKNDAYSDYIYMSRDLYELKGSRYSAKRNLINQFEKNYSSNLEIKDLTVESLTDIIKLTENLWEQTDKKNFDMLECEKKAVLKIKDLWNGITFFGVCVYINKEIKAFAIGSELNDETCVLNFEKADKSVKGLYQFIDREFASLATKKYKYINKESDLGKESLRKSKESYHPQIRLESYILQLKK